MEIRRFRIKLTVGVVKRDGTSQLRLVSGIVRDLVGIMCFKREADISSVKRGTNFAVVQEIDTNKS